MCQNTANYLHVCKTFILFYTTSHFPVCELPLCFFCEQFCVFPSPFAESVCTGWRRGQWSSEERLQSSGHAAGSSHWPPHPAHAQHHPGEAAAPAHIIINVSVLQTMACSCLFVFSTCCSGLKTQMKMWLWKLVSSGWLWLSSPSVKRLCLVTWSSKCSHADSIPDWNVTRWSHLTFLSLDWFLSW